MWHLMTEQYSIWLYHFIISSKSGQLLVPYFMVFILLSWRERDGIISLLKKAVYNNWNPHAEIFYVFHTHFGSGHLKDFNIFHSWTFFCFRGWLGVNWKWSYILLDSNLNKWLCGLKLASFKWAVVGIGCIWGLMWHLGYKVLWLYSHRMRHRCW